MVFAFYHFIITYFELEMGVLSVGNCTKIRQNTNKVITRNNTLSKKAKKKNQHTKPNKE
jgi:hypothetical protein